MILSRLNKAKIIFGAENESEKSLVNKVAINGLIDVAINHFKDFDNSNKKLFK